MPSMVAHPVTLLDALGPDARLNTNAFREEEAIQAVEVRHADMDASILEPNCDINTPVPVSVSETSGFDIFVDGIEVSSVAAWVLGLPVRVAHVAAAAIRRTDKEMSDFVAERLETVVLVPAALPADLRENVRKLHGIEDQKVWIVEVADEIDAPPRDWHFVLREAVSKRREELERDVIVEAASRNGSARIVVDGGIARYRGDLRSPGSVVGLVKSHRHYYFTAETVAKSIYALPEGHRTPVFEAAPSVESQPTYSWYLRLRSSEDGPPWFGLVRVETLEPETALQQADDISAWLLAERAPISLPDARYDRLIYPIRFVEQYLRSRQPSVWQLKALIGHAQYRKEA
jgi:hypothetical protein